MRAAIAKAVGVIPEEILIRGFCYKSEVLLNGRCPQILGPNEFSSHGKVGLHVDYVITGLTMPDMIASSFKARDLANNVDLKTKFMREHNSHLGVDPLPPIESIHDIVDTGVQHLVSHPHLGEL